MATGRANPTETEKLDRLKRVVVQLATENRALKELLAEGERGGAHPGAPERARRGKYRLKYGRTVRI